MTLKKQSAFSAPGRNLRLVLNTSPRGRVSSPYLNEFAIALEPIPAHHHAHTIIFDTLIEGNLPSTKISYPSLAAPRNNVRPITKRTMRPYDSQECRVTDHQRNLGDGTTPRVRRVMHRLRWRRYIHSCCKSAGGERTHHAEVRKRWLSVAVSTGLSNQ